MALWEQPELDIKVEVKKCEIGELFKILGWYDNSALFLHLYDSWLHKNSELLKFKYDEEVKRLDGGSKFKMLWNGVDLVKVTNPNPESINKALIKKLTINKEQLNSWLFRSTRPRGRFMETIINTFLNHHDPRYQIDFEVNTTKKKASELEKIRQEAVKDFANREEELRGEIDKQEREILELTNEVTPLREENKALYKENQVIKENTGSLSQTIAKSGIMSLLFDRIAEINPYGLGNNHIKTAEYLILEGLRFDFEISSYFYTSLLNEKLADSERLDFIRDNLKLKKKT